MNTHTHHSQRCESLSVNRQDSDIKDNKQTWKFKNLIRTAKALTLLFSFLFFLAF